MTVLAGPCLYIRVTLIRKGRIKKLSIPVTFEPKKRTATDYRTQALLSLPL